jgi:hypothetical protein
VVGSVEGEGSDFMRFNVQSGIGNKKQNAKKIAGKSTGLVQPSIALTLLRSVNLR